MAGDDRNTSLDETSMKKKSTSQSAFFSLLILLSLFAILSGVCLALFATSAQVKRPERAVNLKSPLGGVQEEWIALYNGGNGFDVAYATAIDGSGNAYVTGASVGPGNCPNSICNDYATVKYDASGTQQWVARYNGPASDDDHAAAIAVDASGNVYVTGASIGTTFPDYDYATVKYDASGNQLWVARYNGPGSDFDFATAIAVDVSGNVYVTGASVGSGTGFDYATVKYDSSGQQQWVARYNGPGNGDDEAYGIVVDPSGNVYVTGYSGGSGTANDYATIKYNSAGQEQWVARYNGPSNSDDYAKAIDIDGSGNVYVTGSSVGSGSGFDYATVKYDSSGQEQWVTRYNGPANEDDEPYAMAVDPSGNVYVTGYSTGSDSGYDYTTIKYNASGTEEWVARYNGAANLLDIAYAIALDASGDVYVTGWSVGLGTGYDYATVKYDSSGQEQWVARYNGTGNDDDQAYAIAVDASANVYVTGYGIGSDGVSYYTTIKYSQSPSTTPTPTPTATPTPTPIATATPSATPRPTPTPRLRPTPAPRPSAPR
jgi:hypothetical protein